MPNALPMVYVPSTFKLNINIKYTNIHYLIIFMNIIYKNGLRYTTFYYYYNTKLKMQKDIMSIEFM